MEAFVEATSGLGFPIAVAIFFVYQNKALNEKFIELAKQSSADSTASTEAIKKATDVIERNTEAFNKLTAILDSKGH